MKSQPIDIKRALVDVVDQVWPSSEHPASDAIERFRRGELGEAQAEPLRAHLLGCRECMTRWSSPEVFADPRPVGEAFERAAFWHTLRPRLGEQTGERPAEVTEIPRRARPWPRRLSPWLAAACVVLVGGLSLWLQDTRRELTRPRANAPIFDLDASFEPRDGGVTQVLEVPAGVGFTLLITPETIASETLTGEPLHQLGILDAGGREIYTVSGLIPHPRDGTFSLWLPAGALAAGDYRLELRRAPGRTDRGADHGEAVLLEAYALRVIDSP